MKKEIKLREAILHILDSNVSMPVLSAYPAELTEEIRLFLEKHLQKILDDGNLQEAAFTNDSRIKTCIEAFTNKASDLVGISHYISGLLFDLMLRNIDIPAADLVVCIFDCDGAEHIGILKMNYKTGYSHYVVQTDEGASNMLVLQKTLLPQETQKLSECAVISLQDMNILLLQREYEIDGEKEDYWSKLFLQCSSRLSSNSKLNILEKSVRKVAKKYFDEDFEKVAKTKKAVAETLEETGVIQVEELADEVFEQNEDIKREYIQELHKSGIRESSVAVAHEQLGRKIRNQKIKTDTGIEIDFPSSYVNDKDKIEFVNNIDGTISIVIKNVGRIRSR